MTGMSDGALGIFAHEIWCSEDPCICGAAESIREKLEERAELQRKFDWLHSDEAVEVMARAINRFAWEEWPGGPARVRARREMQRHALQQARVARDALRGGLG